MRACEGSTHIPWVYGKKQSNQPVLAIFYLILFSTPIAAQAKLTPYPRNQIPFGGIAKSAPTPLQCAAPLQAPTEDRINLPEF